MSTTLIQDTTLLKPGWAPWNSMESVGPLFEDGEILDFEEDWGPNGVELTATLSIDSPDPISIGGFDVAVGLPNADSTEFEFSLTFDSEPLFAAVSVILLGGGLITAEDVRRTAEKLDIDPNALDLQKNPEYFHDLDALGRVRARLELPEVHLLLPEEHLRVGRPVTENGSTVGVEPVPDDPRPTIKLAEPTVIADTEAGVSATVGGPQDVTLPPLLVRGSGIALEFKQVAPDFSTASGHPGVTSKEGYDESWQGLYVGETTIWGLDELLPFLPDHLDSESASGGSENGHSNGGQSSDDTNGDGSNGDSGVPAGGSRLTFSDWLIDENGASGSVSLVIPPSVDRDGLLQLRKLTLGFDRAWIPQTISSEVELSFSSLSNGEGEDLKALGEDGTLTLATEFRYDPEPDAPPARFGFDIVVRGGDDEAVLELPEDDLGQAAPVVFAVTSVLAAPLDEDLAVVMAAMATLESTDRLKTKRVAVDELSFEYDAEKRTANGESYWARVLTVTASTSVEAQLKLAAADIDTPLGLGIDDLTVTSVLNHGKLEEVGAADQSRPVSAAWDMKNVGVTLSASANLANAVTITDVGLRMKGGEFLIELGVEAGGSGDVSVTGVPDAVVLAFDAEEPNVGDFKGVRLKERGKEITILAPGAIYASGRMQTGEEVTQSFPAPDPHEWTGGMKGSLRAFVIGNGTATTPADHKKRESYQYGFDVDLLSAQRSDGMTTLVVTIDGTFTPGIPLGQSGASLYGVGLVYAQNAQPALSEGDDLAEWYNKPDPKYSTDAPKWEPALDEWGFGASAVLGSTPDGGKSWSAKAGLFLRLPGPVVMIAGKAALFSEKPSLGGGEAPDLSAVIVLDFEDDVFSIDVKAGFDVPKEGPGRGKLVTVDVPVELFVDLQNPDAFHLYFGQYKPEEKRAAARALGMLDLSAYLMLDGQTIAGLPVGDLPGLALAMGGEAQVKWGLDAGVIKCYLYAGAAFHLGVSLAEPMLLNGMVKIEGGLVVKVFGFGPELGVCARLRAKAPEPLWMTGAIRVDIDLPWPLDDVHESVPFALGSKKTLPDAPDPVEGVSAHSRYENKSQELSESAADNDPVPVDTALTLSFDAPVGNESGTVGSFNTGGTDADDKVWKIVSSAEREKDDVKKRHREGYRYEVTDASLIEVTEDADRKLTGQPATWDPKVTGGGNTKEARESDAVTKATGGIPARDTLQLLDATRSQTTKYVGTAAEVVRETEASWDPCTPGTEPDTATYHAADLPTGDIGDAVEKLTQVDPETPPAHCLTVPPTDAGRSLGRLADLDVSPAMVRERPWPKDSAPIPAMERRRLLSIPQAVGRTEYANEQLANLETRPCEALDLVVPEHEEVTVRLLLFSQVDLHALPRADGESAGDPLEPELVTELHRSAHVSRAAARAASWGIYEVTATSGIDVIRLWARRHGSDRAPESMDAFAATVLDVTADLPGSPAGGTTAEADAMNDLYGDLLNATLSDDAPGVLKPDTEYKLSVTVAWTQVEQWGESSPSFDGGEADGSHSSEWTFRTASDPRETLRPTDDPDGSRDDWDVATLPRDGATAFYRGDDIEVEFRTAQTLAAFDAHAKAFAVRVVDEQGRDQFDAVDVTEEVASELPPTAEQWRTLLKGVDCLSIDPEQLYRRGSATIDSVLDPETRYVASLHAVDADADLEDVKFQDVSDDYENPYDEAGAPVVHSWRFETSAHSDVGEHLAAHEPVDELTDGALDEQSLESRATSLVEAGDVTVDDEGLDELLHDDLGLAPRDPPDSPEVVRVWRWQPASDAADPLAILFDGPEPLARDDHEVVVEQNGRELDGRFLTRTDRARVLFVPDAGELLADADCTVEVSHDGGTDAITVPVPKRPEPLRPTGVAP